MTLPKSSTPEYKIWGLIKQRCFNHNNKDYKGYGGRGILMCDRWRISFESFILDMGFRPSIEYSIERIDNDKGYSPANCKWILKKDQHKNRRGTKFITYKGETLSYTEWSRKLGLADNVVGHRIKAGWSEEMAVTTKFSKGNKRFLAYQQGYEDGFNAAIDEAVKIAIKEHEYLWGEDHGACKMVAGEIKELKQ